LTIPTESSEIGEELPQQLPQPKPYEPKIKSHVIKILAQVFSKTNPLYEDETTPLLCEGGPSQSSKVKNKNRNI
jgi:hypothetical protein